nr:unnamed protein product [Spirometra erinaceieuropaei]
MAAKRKTPPPVISSKLASIKCYLYASDDDDDVSDEGMAQSKELTVKPSEALTNSLLVAEGRRVESVRKSKPVRHNSKTAQTRLESSRTASPSQESSDTASDEQSVHLSSENEEVEGQSDCRRPMVNRKPSAVAPNTVVLKHPPAANRVIMEPQAETDGGRAHVPAESVKHSRRYLSTSASNRGQMTKIAVGRNVSAGSVTNPQAVQSPFTQKKSHLNAGLGRERMQTDHAAFPTSARKRLPKEVVESCKENNSTQRACFTEANITAREQSASIGVKMKRDGDMAIGVTNATEELPEPDPRRTNVKEEMCQSVGKNLDVVVETTVAQNTPASEQRLPKMIPPQKSGDEVSEVVDNERSHTANYKAALANFLTRQHNERRRKPKLLRMEKSSEHSIFGGLSGSEEESEEETKRQKEQEERRKREEEAAAERQKKQEEKMKREAEEAAKKPRKPGQKRKGLGGLSPEKKRLLKQLIMQKAADEMRNEMKKRQEEKENYLRSKVQPLALDGLDDAAVIKKIKELYERMKALEGEKYDWEVKIRRQDFEINELTIKVNDVKGKFVKPVLKKVSKTENMARFEKKESQSLASFRSQLKSTGQNKFALEEKEDGAHLLAKCEEPQSAESHDNPTNSQ